MQYWHGRLLYLDYIGVLLYKLVRLEFEISVEVNEMTTSEKVLGQSSVNAFLRANFAPVTTENVITDLPVSGTIPPELNGRFLRIGPNPVGRANPKSYHWFMGAGMVHGLRLNQGRAEWYRNSYVLSNSVAQDLKRKSLPKVGKRRGDSVNTNVLAIAGDLYALVEAGDLPIRLDSDLQSEANSDFGGTLNGGFSAHPRRDPQSGELHVLTYEPGKKSVDYLLVDTAGRARKTAEIAAPHMPMIHDTAITPSYVVVLDLPFTFDVVTALSGNFPYAWNHKRQGRIGLLPRSGDANSIRWFETPLCYVYHILNAYEDGDKAVVDVVKNSTSFDASILKRSIEPPELVRWILDLTSGRLQEMQLSERAVEFPRLNDKLVGQNYRYGYTAEFTANLEFGSAFKHDLLKSETIEHNYGEGRVTMEPVFVAKENAAAEDEGWLMSYVFDKNTNRSDVVILDAQNFEDDPVAVIHLPVRVPFGFHGNWVNDSELKASY